MTAEEENAALRDMLHDLCSLLGRFVADGDEGHRHWEKSLKDLPMPNVASVKDDDDD